MKNLVAVSTFAMLGILVAPAQAEVSVNQSSDIDLLVFVPCANNGLGELVDLKGPLHTLITFNMNGNNVSGKAHYQPQGISGIGQSTGVKYHAVGVTQGHFKGSVSNGPFNLTHVNNYRIIGQGPGNNFSIHENFHLTINANGELTTSHDNFSVDCK